MNSKSILSSFLRKMSCHKTLPIKKLLLFLFLLLILLLLLLRPSPSPPTTDCYSSKIPETLAETIIHYATSNSTPQQTLAEISVAAGVLRRRSPCRFLVFGLGLDSPMWAALNHAGRTVFLEEDDSWIAALRARFPSLEAYHVRYNTRVADAGDLMELGRRPECSSLAVAGRESACRLALKGLPEAVYEEDWDVIMVDGPTGWMREAPGRMGAIYTAGTMARGRKKVGDTDVFVHDVDRKVEDDFSKEFLCKGYMREQVGRLRHFTIPPAHSYKEEKEMMSFCPSSLL